MHDLLRIKLFICLQMLLGREYEQERRFSLLQVDIQNIFQKQKRNCKLYKQHLFYKVFEKYKIKIFAKKNYVKMNLVDFFLFLFSSKLKMTNNRIKKITDVNKNSSCFCTTHEIIKEKNTKSFAINGLSFSFLKKICYKYT